MELLYSVLILICIYIVAVTGYNLLAGYAGLVSMAPAALLSVGAYTAGILSVRVGLPWYVLCLASVLISSLAGLAFGLPSLRLAGDYFIIATFALAVTTQNVINNWVSLTHGPLGLFPILRPVVAGQVLASNLSYLVFALALTLLAAGVGALVATSPFGLALRASRDGEVAAESLGRATLKLKASILWFSGGLLGLAGAMFAFFIQALDPSIASFDHSVLLISMLVVGGAGSWKGAIVGPIIIVGVPQILQLLGAPTEIAAVLQEMAYGAILVGFVWLRPKGILGEYSFK